MYSNLKLTSAQQNVVQFFGFDFSKAELVKFLSNAIKIRLSMIQPYLDQWPQAMALLSKPSNAPQALSNLMTLVDDICFHAGDRSIDVRRNQTTSTRSRRVVICCNLMYFYFTDSMVHQTNRLGHDLQIQRIAFAARQIARVQRHVEFREKGRRRMRETRHDARE